MNVVTLNPVLETRALCVRYGNIEAVRSAALRVRAGEIACVIGPNGAGKSSLLNAIMGALPLAGSASGEVLYRGEDISHRPIEQRLERGLALVPETRELFTSMTVEDNLVLGAYRRHKEGASFRDSLENIYRLFPRLRERRLQLAGTMSGGERQMVAIGRALMSDPQVLMLDEPSLGLAPLIVRDVLNVIDRLRDTGVATLLIEQNSRAALQVADYGYVLELGDITLEGPTAELRSDPRVIDAYLGARRA
ncbi:MAG: ABC transporter ATP-binding protein [Betaproteobacteria bacterium HGW-Betaproteobacteria-9]|jgi:branched-chain amino acid transport system ATP-binding protein|nr:ABC transporter ATP-binding protein [Hydrogenophaga sp.]PKO26381.1 MAG: ABC transporter ATP-binding protein [Betaproteobacteria bacterium HGW-Betaproteobacteria-9]